MTEQRTRMTYGRSQWGSPYAVCPHCNVKCIYWDDDDLDLDDGHLYCYCKQEDNRG